MKIFNIPMPQNERYSFKRVVSIILYISLNAFIFAGCESTKIVSASKLKLQQDFCVSASVEDYSQLPVILQNKDSLFSNETELGKFLTKQEILMANASGTLKLIKDIISLAKDTANFSEKLFFEYSIGVQKNISIINSEIDGLSAELQCESFRTRQLSTYLGNLNAKRNSKLTVGAIAVGSLTTILPVFVTGNTPQNIILISGGVLAAGLGVATLKPGRYELKMMTYRNLLENIWNGNTGIVIYPPAVSYFLNEPGFGSSQGISIAQVLKMRWLKFDLNNSLDKTTENLLFGNGGIFNEDNLNLRATMLLELEAEVNSMKQYLDHLTYKIDNLKLHVLHGVVLNNKYRLNTH